MSRHHRHPATRRDTGAVLPLVLVVAIVFALVTVALARLVTADLRASSVAEERAERKAAAVGAINYGVERLRLGQTLCNSAAGGFGTITPALLDRNDTTTTLQCTRTGTGSNDITGWTVIITGQGITSDLLLVQGGGTKRITGSMYVRDVTDIRFVGAGTAIEHRDGDLWHTRSSCPGGAVTLPSTYTFNPSNARGPICTTQAWTQLVAAPTIPNLNTLPVNDGTTYTTVGSCRVFSPGRYTDEPDTEASSGPDPDLYFQSGNYWFDGVGEIELEGQVAWFGHNRTTTPAIANPDCEAARLADPNLGGSGAVAFMGGNSRFAVESSGSIEFFDRTLGQYQASIVAIPSGAGYTASTVAASSGSSGAILAVSSGATNQAVVRGLVYTPNASVLFDNASNSARQQLLGGAVVARLSIQASASASGFIVSTATTPTLSKLVLTATSNSVSTPGASTTVQAIVDYRPDLPPASRVAVNSLRVTVG